MLLNIYCMGARVHEKIFSLLFSGSFYKILMSYILKSKFKEDWLLKKFHKNVLMVYFNDTIFFI